MAARNTLARLALGVAVMAVGTLGGSLIGWGGQGLGGAAGATTSPTVSAKAVGSSSETKDQFVFYRYPGLDSGSVTATWSDATRKMTIELEAYTFPYSGKATIVSSITAPSDAGVHSFTVTPTLATHYRVLLVDKDTTVAKSGLARMYVVEGVKGVGPASSCNAAGNRPVCTQRWTVKLFVPPAVAKKETAKHRYGYFAVNLSPTKEPPEPKVLKLDGKMAFSALKKVNPTEYTYNVVWSFRIGNDGYHYDWNVCTKDTESSDGLGLPGRHGCGSSSVPSSQVYVG